MSSKGIKVNLAATSDQIDIVTNPARNICLMAGRRWGKTFTSRNRILHQCLRRPGFDYWYIAPVYAQCYEEFDALTTHPTLRNTIKRAKLQPYPHIIFKNGSRVAYRSFERAKNLRGSGINEFWVDEIQDIKEADFFSVLRPIISDSRGTLVISGQFRGFNWYYKAYFEPGQDTKRPDYASYIRPSSSGVMFKDKAGKAELAEVKRTIPRAIWDQEYDCIPGSKVNAVFRPDDLEAATRGKYYLTAPEKSGHILSADLGKIVDPTGWVVLKGKSAHVPASGLFPLRLPHAEGAKRLGRLARDFGKARVVIDSTGGATGGRKPQDEYLKIYRREIQGVREFTWSTRNKERIVNDLAVAFEQGEITIARKNEELLAQLAAYEYTYHAGSNRYEYHGPAGHDDDLVAALAQAWQMRTLATRSGGHFDPTLGV